METAEYYAQVSIFSKIIGNPVMLSSDDVKDLIKLKETKNVRA